MADKKDSDSAHSRQAEDEKRLETQNGHQNGVQTLPDPDDGLSAEERAQIVCIPGSKVVDSG